MTQEYNKAIALIIPLIVKNNAGRVAIVLREYGYESRNFIPQSELESALFKLHASDTGKFYEVVNKIDWNYGDVTTNKPEIRDRLMELVSTNTDATAKIDWWKSLLSLLQAQSVEPQPQPAPQQTKTGIWGIVAVVVVIAVVIFFIIKMK